MENKSQPKIQLDASKLVGFAKAGNAGQKANPKLQSKVGEKVGRKPMP